MPLTEVVVTLPAPPLAALGRSLLSARSRDYGRVLAAEQARAERRILRAVPGAQVRWRYRLVANGFAIVLPRAELNALRRVPGVAKVWPSFAYHDLRVQATSAPREGQGPQAIGADRLWGPSLATAGAGMKIGIIDDGLEATHPFFDPSAFQYPPGFPKGQTQYATPKVIVQRAFPPPGSSWKYARRPFDPSQSFHATHVAGIAAGDHAVADGALSLSGIAPEAYLGNYKALTTPTADFGLDGNSAEITAAIEAAVSDGMNVINLSLGEPEVAPSRDIVVQALDQAAKLGVAPVVAAGNDFDEFGLGTIDSPANAAGAITVAATTAGGSIADFSSAGPTPLSLQLKPDVSAPGVAITSSLPDDQGGPWGQLNGTSMATPYVAGGVALLKERHPDWTVPQLKSALVQTGLPVRGLDGREVSVLREGGGLIDLPRADNPLLFADPTAISFPVNGGARTVALTDAGGGAGGWSASIRIQNPLAGVTVTTDPSVDVPGQLTVTASAATTAGNANVTGFVILSRDGEIRRIPFWLEVDHPLLGTERSTPLTKPGIYSATTAGKPAKISSYRFPTAGDSTYAGPEIVYRVRITRPIANFGVAVLSGTAVPHVTFAGDENHLVGYTGLPVALNPYVRGYGDPRPIAGAVLPTPGTYDIVFDTRTAADAGPFRFRFWLNDTKPPRIAIAPAGKGTIAVSVTDAGAGVDPQSLTALVDRSAARIHLTRGRFLLHAAPGRHTVTVSASDYQEAKNMEDVVAIRPNTSRVTRTIVVR